MSGKLLKTLILGAPASGKGTISSRIVKKYAVAHVSSGDKLRDHIEKQTDLGKEVKKYLNEGKLVPDDVMIKFMITELKKLKINHGYWMDSRGLWDRLMLCGRYNLLM